MEINGLADREILCMVWVLCLRNSSPPSTIASRIGSNFRPNGISAYSTVGGDVGMTSREITPFFSSYLRRVVKTLAEMVPRSRLRSPKR